MGDIYVPLSPVGNPATPLTSQPSPLTEAEKAAFEKKIFDARAKNEAERMNGSLGPHEKRHPRKVHESGAQQEASQMFADYGVFLKSQSVVGDCIRGRDTKLADEAAKLGTQALAATTQKQLNNIEQKLELIDQVNQEIAVDAEMPNQVGNL